MRLCANLAAFFKPNQSSINKMVQGQGFVVSQVCTHTSDVYFTDWDVFSGGRNIEQRGAKRHVLQTHVYIYMCGCVCVCVCVYIYVYIYMHTYIHTYICIMRGGDIDF